MASTKSEVTVYIDGNDPAVIARMQELITENERYRRALGWYAAPYAYISTISPLDEEWQGEAYQTMPILQDGGGRAQKALTRPQAGSENRTRDE